MCLDVITKKFPENNDIKYGWKVFTKYKNKDGLFGWMFGGPYETKKQYFAAVVPISTFALRDITYFSGYHYFDNQHDTEKFYKYILSTHTGNKFLHPYAIGSFPICRIKTTQQICMGVQKFDIIYNIWVAKTMEILEN